MLNKKIEKTKFSFFLGRSHFNFHTIIFYLGLILKLNQNYVLSYFLQIKITTFQIKIIFMHASEDSHQQRLEQIRQKYGGKSNHSEYRPKTSYKPSSTYTPSDSIRRSYMEDVSPVRISEQSYRREPGSASLCPRQYQKSAFDSSFLPQRSAQISKNREIEKIRQEYAASRKKVIEDFTGQPGIPPNKDYHKNLFNKYDAAYPPSSLLTKPQLAQNTSSSYLKKDYTSDVYKRITQRQNAQNPQTSSKYSQALEKAYEFGKNLGAGKTSSSYRENSYSNPSAIKREFGKQYNIDEHRLSFGKIDSNGEMSKKYELLDRYYENSSPIKKVQNASDLQSKFASPTKYDKYERQYLKGTTDSQSHHRVISSRPNMDSPSQYGQWDVKNIDRMQTRIQSILDEKKIRY